MSLNLDPWLNKLSITDKQSRQVLLDPNWSPAQRQVVDEVQNAYSEGRPCRIICLKARQLGLSTVSCALGFTWATLFPRTSAFVVAHTAQQTTFLFDKVRMFYEQWPLKGHYPTRYSSRREMAFSSNGSFVRVQTARNPTALAGRTIQFLHASEVALWERQEEAMLVVRQTVFNAPGSVIILESTANGIGNWFEATWREAEAGLNDYTPVFAPWFTHHEYIPCNGDGCRDGSCEVCIKVIKGLRPKDDEERRLLGLGCDVAHLAWRRWALPNLTFDSEDYYREQYPSTAQEAFLTSGVGVFPQKQLDQVYERAKPALGRITDSGFVLDSHGPLRVYKPPADDKEWGQYFIGADPCFGSVDGDYAAACVINRQTKEQVAVWHGRINPYAFADELIRLGKWYNDAVISCEVNGPGQGTMGRLAGLYPRLWHHRIVDRIPSKQRSEVVLGWSGNWQRKQWLVTQLADAVERGDIIIHDRPTYEEMRIYSFYGDKGDIYGPSGADNHDDLVMALGIAVLCERLESPTPPYEVRQGVRSKDREILFGEVVDVAELLEASWG